jgi:dihydropteroate synthase
MVDLRAPDGARLGERPFVMGILNVTPDSFSDGGQFAGEAAVEHARRMAGAGADVIDVGAESTRPGSDPVSPEEELARLEGVLGAVVATGVPVSIDTTKAEVARYALDAGAVMVNDVSACRFDPGMAPLAARRGCPLVLMHMLGMPKDMQTDPRYPGGVVEGILGFLRERVDAVVAEGVDRGQLIIDPGIGFGKTVAQNLTILQGIPDLRSLGLPVLVGASRKWFIGQVTGREVGDRLSGSLAAAAAAVVAGADIVRAHDVEETVLAVRVAHAIARPDRW